VAQVPVRVVVIGAELVALQLGVTRSSSWLPSLSPGASSLPGDALHLNARGFTFDVGATQVAGAGTRRNSPPYFLELEIDLPEATPCDPACAVYLPGETEPINVWRDPERWQKERQRQFIGSEPFWQLLALFQASWAFQSRDPVLPPRNLRDLWQLTKAVRPNTLPALHSGDALRGMDWGPAAENVSRFATEALFSGGCRGTALLYAAALSVPVPQVVSSSVVVWR